MSTLKQALYVLLRSNYCSMYPKIEVTVTTLTATGALVYTTKIPACVYVSGYAFRSPATYRNETWHGGRGRGPEAWEQLYEVT